MQAIDLHRKLQQISKRYEYGEYIPVVNIINLLGVPPEIVLTHLTVLHDLSFLEYSKRSQENVRLTITGKLANLVDCCTTSNDFEKTIKKSWEESGNEVTAYPPTVFAF